MRARQEILALLARMEAAREQTRRHLARVERRVEITAERVTKQERPKRRRHSGRGTSMWSAADERAFQERLADLTLRAKPERDALARKLARQDAALAAFRERHGSADPKGRPAPACDTDPDAA